jgi:hypothetical protein
MNIDGSPCGHKTGFVPGTVLFSTEVEEGLEPIFLSPLPAYCIYKNRGGCLVLCVLAIKSRAPRSYFLDSNGMRKFLYSKWFFGFLAFVCILDLFADAAADILGWQTLHKVTIGLELISVYLTVAMFRDLHRRMKVNGRNPRS